MEQLSQWCAQILTKITFPSENYKMSQVASSGSGTALNPAGDTAHVQLTPSSPHPLSVVKPRTLTSKEEDEEIIKEVVRY